jgi:hypothetical protein
LNQALRHLWTKAYQTPLEPILGGNRAGSSLEDLKLDQRVKLAEPKPRIGKPRILIAKPKVLGPKKSTIALGPQESFKNSKVLDGLTKMFGADKMSAVLAQANTIFHVTNPNEALEMFGSNWNIGRPKLE